MIDWFKKHRVLFALICVVILLLLMGVPFVINILFKINATTDILVAEWSAGDALGYYGAILSFLGTVVLGALALYQNHIIKTEADKKAALAEEQERAENMPRFFLRFQCASGFCGSLKFAVMNVSNNIAYTVDVYDIKIKGGSKTIWESDDTYGAPVINPQKEMTIQTKSPATNETGEFTLFATMSYMDKYDGKHEYILIPVAELTASRIQTFLYYLQAEKQLSRRTISLVRSILIQLYDYAVEMSLAPINPARSTKLPRQPQRSESEEKVIPIAQREAVLAAAQKDPIMRPIITTLLFTGMRIGELLALQWKHINFAAHTITIAQSVTRELTFDENGKTIEMTDALGSTKTRTSHRVIQAPELVLTRLREWMRYVATLPKGLEVLTPEGFVFISTRTMSMRTYSGFRASYRHFMDRNGFSGEGLNLHRYRHTYASMLLEQEINPRIVQKLLGHRDVSTTLGIYTHVVPEVFTGVAAAVDTASQQLMDGTYTPKRSAEAVRAQLQQIDPMLSEDMTVNLKYL